MKLIAAVDQHWALGRDGHLLFSIPDDLHHFRRLTINGTILYGRKTLLTFPNKMPLPHRKNVILTHTPASLPPTAIGCSSIAGAIQIAGTEAFVVGGASIYQKFLPYCTHAYITKVFANGNGDCFLTNLDLATDWQCISSSEIRNTGNLSYQFLQYEKII